MLYIASQAGVFFCCIADMEDNVVDCIVVKRSKIFGKFHVPSTDSAHSLKGHIAIIPEVKFENTCIILRCAGRDTNSPGKLDVVKGVYDIGLGSDFAVCKRQCCAYVCVGTCHARDRDTSGFDHTVVMSWVEQVKRQLGYGEGAFSILAQSEQGIRCKLCK